MGRYDEVYARSLRDPEGFWGEMAVQRAAPAQLELNKLLARLQDSMHLHAVIRAFVQPGSLQTNHLQNDVGQIVEVSGPPPVFAPVPSMLFAWSRCSHSQDRADASPSRSAGRYATWLEGKGPLYAGFHRRRGPARRTTYSRLLGRYHGAQKG